jgi:hypothetical protein
VPYNASGAYVSLAGTSAQRVREDTIRSKMSAALPQLTECYRIALVMVGSPVAGTAEMSLSIDERGGVTSVVNAPKLPPFARCAQRAVAFQVPVNALENPASGATASQFLTFHP